MNETLVIVVGTIAVILIPSITTILWNTWKANTEETRKNTLVMAQLTGKIDIIWEVAKDLPELKKDVSYLKSKNHEFSEFINGRGHKQ